VTATEMVTPRRCTQDLVTCSWETGMSIV